MIIDDLMHTNANLFMNELKSKRRTLISVRDNADPNGDYTETVQVQIDIIEAALEAANNEYHKHVKPACPADDDP